MSKTLIVGRAIFTMSKLGGDDVMKNPTKIDPVVKGWKVKGKGGLGNGQYYLTRDYEIVAYDLRVADEMGERENIVIEEVEHSLSWWQEFEANAPEFGGW